MKMFLCVMAIGMSGLAAPDKTVALPDTPQGKHVQAWIAAFNSGNEKTFLEANDAHMTPDSAARNPPAQRATMFKRMRENFGTFKVDRVVRNAPEEIVIEIPTHDGSRGTFTFAFETQAPYRISKISIAIE